ncbi:hypothetical protein KP509_14G035900 [Ceratopteris richardii]|uniref:Uncharacterized protein n=1 Tax=Ceratopteris richardii TaxID=49495 RepID=A0A8T2T8Y1_CERRI|nr:hypothetical protein KP509_14G035900 [Ceratopteris richardii]
MRHERLNNMLDNREFAIDNLRNLLEEDDESVSNGEINVNFGRILAYQAKASEFAALMRQGSPSLRLNLSLPKLGDALHQGPSPASCFPTSPINDSPSTHKTSQLTEKVSFWMHGSESRPLEGPPICVPCTRLDDEPIRDLPSEAMPDHGNRSSNHRREKHSWIGYALKPRKEVHKVIGKPLSSASAFVDINQLLLRCADAIGSSDNQAAMQALLRVKQFASPNGDGAQRMAYYFVDALEARLSGTGWQVYFGQMGHQRASPKEIFKAGWTYMLNCPFAKATRYFVNQTILAVAKGAKVLHIIEYKFTGFQYPSLFKMLAERPGGPPQVRLIAVNVPDHSMTSSQEVILYKRLEHTGRQVAACAASFGVPFHFTAWIGKTGTLEMKDYVNPNREPEEVLVVLSVYPLRYINEDILSPPEKRQKMLQKVLSLNPEAFIQGFVTASYSTPFFCRRFREALYHFECQYDMLDTFIDRENADRFTFESEILGRSVVNIVACEETHVVEKVEKYNQCFTSVSKVGFEQIPVNQDLQLQIQNILQSWHSNYTVANDLNYVLMGWKGCMLHALGVWKGLRV